MTAASIDGARRPDALLQLMELRAFWEFGATLALRPLWSLAPRGDGHPVMVLPGLGAGDESTGLLRHFLASRGYAVHPWAQGANPGLRARLLLGAHARLQDIAGRHGRKPSLVGWSLGGVYARALAHHSPHLVRQVITLGAPIGAAAAEATADGLRASPEPLRAASARGRWQWQAAPPVPTTSIWSRSDAVVPWPFSVEAPRSRAENIEVDASHFGLGMNPAVLYAIAERLAQPEDRWQPFRRDGLKRLCYGDAGA